MRKKETLSEITIKRIKIKTSFAFPREMAVKKMGKQPKGKRKHGHERDEEEDFLSRWGFVNSSQGGRVLVGKGLKFAFRGMDLEKN